MSTKRTVSGVLPDLTSKKSRIEEDSIYFLYFHEGPVGYDMYKIDVGAFSIDENASNNAVAISPVYIFCVSAICSFNLWSSWCVGRLGSFYGAAYVGRLYQNIIQKWAMVVSTSGLEGICGW
ncbi:hypothetical protein LOK49_LG13G00078 [Camellia lanceoleosa]|uniref:Uncharacterized protein n=1 Tax=Camellia lanceoleosa TaxID=1840588 RepID=A0ACC0FEX7_9ERIC|nr:hypothetical protein LOK49_LG13G00078 [Camellia lanceoleosa]